MVGWHHRFDGHEFEQALGDSGGQGSLACCSPWGCKESDTTQELNNNERMNVDGGGELHCPQESDSLEQATLVAKANSTPAVRKG